MSTELSAANITRSVIRVEAFVSPETEALVRASAEQNGTDLASQESTLYVGVLRLVIADRRRERAAAWAALQQQSPDELPDQTTWNYMWNTKWSFDDGRREHVMRQYPLQVRAAGRAVMNMVSDQRLDTNGAPLNTPAGRAVRLVPFGTVAAGRDAKPHQIARHLRLSGMHIDGRTRPGGNFSRWQYPSDAKDYLDVYPVAQGFGEGEMDRHQMHALDASDNLLNRIISEQGLYPVVRTFEGRGSREVEGFTAKDVAIIEEEIRRIPPLRGDEMSVRQFFEHLGSEKLGEEALRLSGVQTPYRRLPGQGRGRAIQLRATERVTHAFIHMTHLEPGEAGVEEIAALVGYSQSIIRDSIGRIDRRRGRELYSTYASTRRYVFPAPIVAQILTWVTDRLHMTVEQPAEFIQYRAPKQRPSFLWRDEEEFARGVSAGVTL